jgi:hypothetical protein
MRTVEPCDRLPEEIKTATQLQAGLKSGMFRLVVDLGDS